MSQHDHYVHLPESEDRAMILDVVAAFASEVVAPASAAIDHERRLPDEIRAGLAEAGLLGLALPESHGGVAMDRVTSVLALELLAAANASVALDLVCQGPMALEPLALHADGETAVAVAESVVAGEGRIAFAHLESTNGVGPEHVRTHAVLEGDGVRLEGRKTWCLGAPDATEFLVTAREDGRISAFLVPATAEGVTVGPPVERLGMRGVRVADLKLEDVTVGPERRVGASGAGAEVVAHALLLGRLGLAAVGAGLMRASRDCAARYAVERRQFGRAIAEFEAIREKLADIETSYAATLSMTVSAAGLVDAGRSPERLVAAALLQASEAAMRAADDALQVFGGYGYSEEYPAERLYRDARYLAVALGGRDPLRVDLAGRLLPRD